MVSKVNNISFFFSSRRRHTRYWRDWSSDVCSSDLTGLIQMGAAPTPLAATRGSVSQIAAKRSSAPTRRSEERRVGKECRSRWSRYYKKKNTETTTKKQRKRCRN